MSFTVMNAQKHRYHDHQGIFSSWIHNSIVVSRSIQYLKGRCLVFLRFGHNGPNSFTCGGENWKFAKGQQSSLSYFCYDIKGKQQKSIQSENFRYTGLEIILLLYLCKVIPEMFLYASIPNPVIVTPQHHSACELEFNSLFFLEILSIKGHLLGLSQLD